MGHCRLPSPCKKMTRHSSRRHACGRGRGYMYAFISLLLFCMLAVFHTKLGAIPSSDASPVARFFMSPISQSESNSNKVSSSSRSASLEKVSLDSDVTEPKLENSTGSTGSLSIAEDEDEEEEEDEDQEVQEEDNVEEDDEDEEDEEHNGEEEAGLEGDRRKLKDVRTLHDSGTHAPDKMVVGGMLLSNTNYVNVKAVSARNGHGVRAEMQTKKTLLKLGGIKTLARWDPLEDMGGRRKEDYAQRVSNSQPSLEQPFDKSGGSRWHGVTWDHLLGVVRKMDPVKSSMARKIKPGAQHSNQVSLEVNQPRSSSSHITQNFGSDDEPSDLTVIDKLEDFTSIEDALLLKGKHAFLRMWAEKKPTKGDAFKKDRPNKVSVDPLNPIINPLLQDPDTFGSSGLSGSDKLMLKTLQRRFGKAAVEMQETAHANADNTHTDQTSQTTSATNRNGASDLDSFRHDGRVPGNAAERSILELSNSGSSKASEGDEKQELFDRLSTNINSSSNSDSSTEKHVSKNRMKSSLDTRRWGFYPSIHPKLGFSEFMDQFLGDKSCSHNIFMVWTTPPWTYTVRYQRGLESLLYFHPKACVVVFSESIELDFFKSFVDEGFRVAVVAPNLEELLYGTPAAVFSYFWLSWRKTPLFYIHYSELLRLAALYKYGGIYLDTDVILLKPLGVLHNTIGAETIKNQTQKLNGAVMAFEKYSVFLRECLVELTETYDDQLLDFNGAGLVTRVAERIRGEGNRSGEQATGALHVELPHVFFPLSRADIKRYLKAPESRQERLETDRLFGSIYNQSSMLHLWNAQTRTLVPEPSSLVERIINHHCIRCYDFL